MLKFIPTLYDNASPSHRYTRNQKWFLNKIRVRTRATLRLGSYTAALIGAIPRIVVAVFSAKVHLDIVRQRITFTPMHRLTYSVIDELLWPVPTCCRKVAVFGNIVACFRIQSWTVTHPSTNRARCRLTSLIKPMPLTTTLCHHTGAYF